MRKFRGAKGIVLERRVKNDLISQGYLAIRSPRSLGLFDVWAVNKDGIRLIQIKYNAIKKEEVERIRAFDNLPKNATKEVWIYKKGEFEKMKISTSAFGELIDLFSEYRKKECTESTITGYQRVIKDYQDFLDRKGINPLKIQSDQVRAYLAELWERDLSAQTISIFITTLRKFYTFLFRYEIVKENIFDRISNPKVSKALPEVITENEMMKFLDSIKNPLDAAVCEFIYATGVRTNEIFGIDCEDIDMEKGIVRVINLKDEERHVPITRKAIKKIKAYRQYIEKPLKGRLFINSEGSPFMRNDLEGIMKRCSDGSGIGKNITPKTIRQSLAVHLLNRGADLVAVTKILGLENIQSALPYAQLTTADKKAVIDNFLSQNGEANTETIKSPLAHTVDYFDDAMPKKIRMKYRFEK